MLVSIYICSPKASHTYEQVMSRTSMSEVGHVTGTHMKESCHTYKRSVPTIHIKEVCLMHLNSALS